jgi:type II secretory pathway component GspD/PulD (secretin)
MRLPPTRHVAFWLLALALPVGAEPVTDVIPLNARLPEEVIPTLRPLVGPGGSVTAFGGKLVVRAEPSRLEDVRRVLEEIDHPPHRLVIHVRQRDALNADLSGGGVVVQRGTVGAQVRNRQTRGAGDATQRVMALEGQPAQILAGVSVPVTTNEASFGGWWPGQERTIAYRDATAGFRVVPRLAGDSVTLEIQQHAVRPQGGAQAPPFAVQEAQTTVCGRLGEWLPLGAVTTNASQTGRGIARSFSTRREGDVQVEVMVELLPDR